MGKPRIDGLWLDVQGTELAALKGAGSLLDDVRAIVVEVSSVELYEGYPLWPEVRAWVEDRGFRLSRMEMQDEYTGDALFIRR